MADFLTAHLKAKGEERPMLATLVNQWGFDVQLIPKALQTVGSMFPHYSRHDLPPHPNSSGHSYP